MDSVTLTQAGRMQPTISVSPSSRTVGADAFIAPDNQQQFGGVFNAFTIDVDNLIDADGLVGWRSSIDSGFVRLIPNDNGSVTSNASIQTRGIDVDINPTQEERTAVISFFTLVGGNVTVADTARVTVTQAGRVGAISPTLDIVGTGLGATDTMFMDRTGTPEVTLSFDVQYGSWSAMSEGFLTLSNLNAASEGDCSTSRLCGGGAVDNTKRRVIFKANGSAYGGSDRRTANVTMTVTGADGTTTSKVITIIQRGFTRLNITSDLDTLASGDGSTSAISFTTNGTWEAMSSETFITLSPTTGTGDATITATAGENTGALRTATITIIATGLDGMDTTTTTVSQAAMSAAVVPPELTITPVLDTLAHDNASTSAISFTTNGTWEATSNADFITLSPTMGTGDATITATAASANGTGSLRTATITITATGADGTTPVNRTVMISQDEAPTITNISSSARVIFPNPGANTHDLEDFMVGGSATGWTSTITYMPTVASGGEEFVTLTPDAGPRGTNMSVTAAAEENTTSSQREALITVTTTGRGTPVSNSFTIQQAAAAPAAVPTLTLTPPHTDGDIIRIDHTTNDVQTIEFNVGGGATGWTSAITGDDFITLGGDTTNTTTTTGDVMVTATPTANTDMDAVERSATIRITTIGGAGDSATFAVTITQSASSFDFRVDQPSGATMNSDGSLQTSIVDISAAGVTTENDPIRFRVIPATADVTITSSHFIGVNDSSSLGVAAPTGGGAEVPARTFLIDYRILANNTGADRTGTIVFTVRSPVGSQTFTVTLVQVTGGFGVATTFSANGQTELDENVGGGITLGTLPMFFDDPEALGLNGNITNLDTLRSLRTLGSHLIINGTNLTSLRGLDSLTSVADNLVIINNSMLTSLEGLEALTNVGGHVIIRDNGVLTSLAGLSALGTIGGDVTIVDNGMLTLCCESVTLAAAIDAVRIRDGEIGFHTTISGNGSDNCNDVNELVGCSGTLPQAPEPMLTLTSSNVDTLAHDDASTSSIVFNVADATWTAASDQGFVTLDPSTNDNAAGDNLMLTATASANTTGSLRTATITITATGGAGTTTSIETVMLSQDEVPTITNISNTPRVDVPNSSSSQDLQDFTVGGSATGWTSAITYMPSGGEEFVTLTPDAGPRGADISVTAALDENTTSSQREALITVTTTGRGTPVSNSFTIQQAAAPADPPTLTLTPPHTDGDIIRIDHTTGDVQTIEFNVGGGATGWTSAITGDDFITLGGDDTTMTGDVTITATPTANTDMDAVERSATIRITTIGGAGDSATFAVTITQSASSFDFRVDQPSGATMNSDGSLQTSIVDISAAGVTTENDPIRFRVIPATADVTITSSHFIGVNDSSSLGVAAPTGGGAEVPARTFLIDYRILANNTGADRTGTIVFTVRSPVGSQTFTVTLVQVTGGFGVATTFSANGQTELDENVGGGITLGTLPMFFDDPEALGLNGNITNLDTLRSLRTLGSHLIINGTNLTSLRGLDSLTSVADNLVIINNSMLTSLEGLEALTNVGGHVIIRDNGVLTSLAGLSALGAIGGDVTIVDNGMLTLCCESVTLAAAIDAVRIRDGEIGFHTTISGNGSDNCNDVNELVGCSGTLPQAPEPMLTLTSSNVDTLAHDDASTSSIVFNVADATWTAESDQGFVTLDPSTNGNAAGDNLMLTATASANGTGMLRTATITITATGGAGTTPVTRTVMISQEAAPTVEITNPPSTDNEILFDYTERNSAIGFTIGGSATDWTSNVVYIPADADFITIDPSGNAIRTGTVNADLDLTENTTLGARTAKITIMTTGSRGTPAVSDTITFTQSAAAPTFNVEVTSPAGTTAMNDSILGTITGIPDEGVTTTNNPIQFAVTPSTAVVTFLNDDDIVAESF